MSDVIRVRWRLRAVGRKKRRLEEQSLRLVNQARPVALQALQGGMAVEQIAELTGYQPHTIEKWEHRANAAARRPGGLAALLAKWRLRAGPPDAPEAEADRRPVLIIPGPVGEREDHRG